jgi:hypothetical protein
MVSLKEAKKYFEFMGEMMFEYQDFGFTILRFDEGPNIGKWNCTDGGQTFKNFDELAQKWRYDGKTLEEILADAPNVFV